MTAMRWDAFADRSTARRAAARLLHPDAGGSAEKFDAALAAIDRRFGAWPTVAVTERIEVLVRHSRRGAVAARVRTLRRLYRQTRTRLPLRRRRYLAL